MDPTNEDANETIVNKMLNEMKQTPAFPPIPLETDEMQDVVDMTSEYMKDIQTPCRDCFPWLKQGPSCLAEKMVNYSHEKQRQTTLYLMLASIPNLLDSNCQEARNVGKLLLVFFFSLLTENNDAVMNIRDMILDKVYSR